MALTTWSAPLWQETKAELEQMLKAKFRDLAEVNVNLAIHDRKPEQLGQIGLMSKSVIAVGSGKGGVGKSTIATCLAFGLKRAGCQRRPDGRRRLWPQRAALDWRELPARGRPITGFSRSMPTA